MMQNYPLIIQEVKYLVKHFVDEINFGLENTETPEIVLCMIIYIMIQKETIL